MKLALHSLTAFGCAAIVVACASKPPPPAVATTTSALTPVVEPAAVPEEETCDVTCGKVEVIYPDYHGASVSDARAVIDSMHDDLMLCYRQRLRENPRAHGSPTFDIVIEENGTVRSIQTTGGAPLGPKMMACMTSRMMKAKFAPVRGGGTLRIHVPLILRHGSSPDRDDAI